MKIRTIFACAILAAAFRGEMELQAMGIRAPDRLENDLIADSPEDKLYQALCKEGIDIMKDASLSADGVKSLKKYLGILIEKTDLDATKIRNINPTALKQYIYRVIADINHQYHASASNKAGNIRKILGGASGCLDIVARILETVNNAQTPDLEFDPLALQNFFNEQLANLNNEIIKLYETINSSLKGEGESKGKLKELTDMIRRIHELLHLSVTLGINPGWWTAKKNIQVFHILYTTLCVRSMAGTDMILERECNKKDPPSPQNGNKTFMERYEEWLRNDYTEDNLLPSKADMLRIVEAVNEKL
ncbi:MAG: hypothetical protein LBO73_00395 [Holosporaceae bacterium]|jgi:hypothetical protein|nr:hypothetical protein [Holosporaceae bacterium]